MPTLEGLIAQIAKFDNIEFMVAYLLVGAIFAALPAGLEAEAARDRLTAVLDRLPPAFEYEEDGQQRFVSFSFSAGVTAWVAGDTPASIVKRADEALYDAKRRGKKRVETRPQSVLRGLIG